MSREMVKGTGQTTPNCESTVIATVAKDTMIWEKRRGVGSVREWRRDKGSGGGTKGLHGVHTGHTLKWANAFA
jgi:hypothetical protein